MENNKEKIEKVIICLEEDPLNKVYKYGIVENFSVVSVISFKNRLFTTQKVGKLFKVKFYKEDTEYSTVLFDKYSKSIFLEKDGKMISSLFDDLRVKEAIINEKIIPKKMPKFDFSDLTLAELKALFLKRGNRLEQKRDIISYLLAYLNS